MVVKLDVGITTLARWVADTTLDDIPENVKTAGCEVILDTLGVALGGSTAPQIQALAKCLGSSRGPATLIGTRVRGSALTAALVNGTSGSWLDFDSGHIPPPGTPLLPAGHLPIHVVPAALAVGEQIDATGEDLLVAIITGYDVAARIGISSRLRAEIHPHGTYPALGAAATAARLHKMTADQIGEAMALALGLSLVPPFETGYQGAFVRNVLSGYGAYVGVLAVDLVRAGVTPERDPIGSLYGSIVSPWHDPGLLVEDLGKRWECTRGYIKPYPSVRYGHPAIEAAEILRDRYNPAPDKIDRVLVETYNLPATLSNREPDSELAAKFSLPWAIASILVRGTAGPEDFRAVADPKISRISRLVEVVEDASMTARTPQDRPARVTVWISGDPLGVEVDRSAGGPDKPLASSRVVAKFRSLADPVVGPANATTVIQQVQELTDLARIGIFTSHLALNG